MATDPAWVPETKTGVRSRILEEYFQGGKKCFRVGGKIGTNSL
jgi:hypothetical protein